MLLILGNKNYSSWSLRPWIAMRVAGLTFDEEVISLNAPEFKGRLLQGAGHGQGPTPERRRRPHLGVACDPRICGGEVPGRGTWARRSEGACPRAGHFKR